MNGIFLLLLQDHEARTSTPKRARSLLKKFNDADVEAEHRGGKHDLTPTSKMAIFPEAKCFQVGRLDAKFMSVWFCPIEIFV